MKKIDISFFFMLMTSLIFQSCVENEEVNNTIKGMWSIDSGEIIYQEEIDITLCLESNIIIFDETCSLPTLIESCTINIDANNGTGKYELKANEAGYTLEFDTENKLFSDQIFEVYFDKDERKKLLKMILVSENLWLKCTKGLFNYDANLVDYLIKITPS